MLSALGLGYDGDENFKRFTEPTLRYVSERDRAFGALASNPTIPTHISSQKSRRDRPPPAQFAVTRSALGEE